MKIVLPYMYWYIPLTWKCVSATCMLGNIKCYLSSDLSGVWGQKKIELSMSATVTALWVAFVKIEPKKSQAWAKLLYFYSRIFCSNQLCNFFFISPSLPRKCYSLQKNKLSFRVHMGPGKPGKSWNFIMAFSRTGKSWKKATGPGKSWKSVKFNYCKNMKCIEGSEEN